MMAAKQTADAAAKTTEPATNSSAQTRAANTTESAERTTNRARTCARAASTGADSTAAKAAHATTHPPAAHHLIDRANRVHAHLRDLSLASGLLQISRS